MRVYAANPGTGWRNNPARALLSFRRPWSGALRVYVSHPELRASRFTPSFNFAAPVRALRCPLGLVPSSKAAKGLTDDWLLIPDLIKNPAQLKRPLRIYLRLRDMNSMTSNLINLQLTL